VLRYHPSSASFDLPPHRFDFEFSFYNSTSHLGPPSPCSIRLAYPPSHLVVYSSLKPFSRLTRPLLPITNLPLLPRLASRLSSLHKFTPPRVERLRSPGPLFSQIRAPAPIIIRFGMFPILRSSPPLRLISLSGDPNKSFFVVNFSAFPWFTDLRPVLPFYDRYTSNNLRVVVDRSSSDPPGFFFSLRTLHYHSPNCSGQT